jgi:poly(3-hydroxybutyrate) depolymerase
MKKWICSGFLLLAALAAALPAGAQQTAVPLGSSAAPYGYYEYLPGGYTGGSAEWPVVVFLHGLGEIGNGTTQLSRVLAHGVPYNINNGANYPFIAISPQSPGEWNVASLDAMIEFVKGTYRVDPDRIYLTGISLGGGGTWNYAKAHPEKLAAIVPIATSASVTNGPRLVDLSTWAFHSWGDAALTKSPFSIDWVNAIAGARAGTSPTDVIASYPGTYSGLPGPGQTSDADRTARFNGTSWTWLSGVPGLTTMQGGHPNLTLYSGTAHEIWPQTYANQDVWDWLLAQERDSGPCDPRTQRIVIAGAGAAGSYFPLEQAFDAPPVRVSACEPLGGSGGSDAPSLTSRAGYIDFGPDWQKVRITSTWTRYRAWSTGNQTPYAEVWWDDDTDDVNDSGLTETHLNFNSAQGIDTGLSEPWLRDSDRNASPVTPQERYLLLRTPGSMTDRAKEYAILGYESGPSFQLIEPTGAGTASDGIYFPVDDAFDAQPTLNASDEPQGGTGGNQAPYLAGRTGYIDFGPDWADVRITATWTQYRTWSLGNQTPYDEVWWDDDTDSINDSGLDETEVNFNTAQSLNTGMTEPWLQDRDLIASPVTPQARYLLLHSPSNMTDRAQEYAIVGFIDP